MTNVEKSEISSTRNTKILKSVSAEQKKMSTGQYLNGKTLWTTAAPVLMNATNCLLNQLYPHEILEIP